MANKKTDFEVVREIALSLPGIDDASTPRGFALKFGGKILACQAIHKSADPDSLMVRISFDRREALIGMEPEICYLTDHYLKHPSVLVRLSAIDRDGIRDLLKVACRFASPEPRTKRPRKT